MRKPADTSVMKTPRAAIPHPGHWTPTRHVMLPLCSGEKTGGEILDALKQQQIIEHEAFVGLDFLPANQPHTALGEIQSWGLR